MASHKIVYFTGYTS